MMNTYTISQTAEKTGLSVHTLRYYEQEGLLPFVQRNPSGVRSFRDSDFEWLELINCLKGTGMQIKDIAHFIALCQEGDNTLEERLSLFRERKRAIEDQMRLLDKYMDKINCKIGYYEKACAERGGAGALRQDNAG